MAQKISVSMSDDINGEPASETVEFGLDGVNYQIDLSEENANDLRDALYRFTEGARRVGGRKVRRAATPSGASLAERRERNQELRTWARAHGYTIAERGRVPDEVTAAFSAAKAAEAEQAAAPSPTRASRKKVAAVGTTPIRRRGRKAATVQ